MMYRTYRTPSIWREMDRLQREMNRLFNRVDTPDLRRAPGYPTVNIWAKDDSQIVSAEMPGVDIEDIDLRVEGDMLTISGERKAVELPEGARHIRRERGVGKFTRTFQLPYAVDPDGIEARFKNGVLIIIMPRAEEDKPRKITIQK
jgi:HSP20 family protein